MATPARAVYSRWHRPPKHTHARLRPFFLPLIALALLCQGLRADSPATQPAPAPAPGTQPSYDDSPQKLVAHVTNDLAAELGVEQVQVFLDFNPDSNHEKAIARLIAAQIIVQSRLELAARKQWGKEAEAAVAHACGDNLGEDFAQAQWIMNGDRARAIFREADLYPVVLNRRKGHWKYDISDLTLDLSGNAEKNLQATNATLERLLQDVAKKDAYANTDEFVRHVKEEMAKLDKGN